MVKFPHLDISFNKVNGRKGVFVFFIVVCRRVVCFNQCSNTFPCFKGKLVGRENYNFAVEMRTCLSSCPVLSARAFNTRGTSEGSS